MSEVPTGAVDYHSLIAKDFSASYKTDANRRQRVIVWNRIFDLYASSGARAYDMGCGPGILTADLAARGLLVTGVDGSDGMLAQARQNAAARGLTGLTFEQHQLPLKNPGAFEPADLIISSSVLEYLDSIEEALVGFHQILKPGGVVLYSISNRDAISRLLVRFVHLLTGRPKYLAVLKHFKTIAQLRAGAERSGFEFIEAEYFAGADRLNKLLSLILPARFTNNLILVAARKP